MRPPSSPSEGEEGRAPHFVQSLERGLAVIRAFDEHNPELTLSDVARSTGLTRAAARRFLLTLADLGYVRTDGRWFSLSPRILELGYAYLSSQSLTEVAEPHLERLVAEVHESSSVSVLDGEDIVYVARVPTSRIMTVSINVGTRFPAYATSMGRVLLAAFEDERARRLPGRRRSSSRCRRARSPRPTRCARSWPRCARQGWALVDQELEEGLRSVAAPIRDRSGATIAAVNLSAHASRMSLDAARRGLDPTAARHGVADRGRPADGLEERNAALRGRGSMSRAAEAVARPQPGGASAHAVFGVMAAIVLLALNLRTLVAGLPPLLDDIRDDLGLSGLAGGLLTALPVLGFGAFAPAGAAALAAGVGRAAAGRAARCSPRSPRRCGGRAASRRCSPAARCPASPWRSSRRCCPAYIRATHPEATGMLTGAYSMSLTLGAALAAALAVPLEEWLGSWEASLAAWSVPALIAAAVWLPPALRAGTRRARRVAAGTLGEPARVEREPLHGHAVDGVLRRAELDPDRSSRTTATPPARRGRCRR